jgi:flagellar hook-length control protein FliK
MVRAHGAAASRLAHAPAASTSEAIPAEVRAVPGDLLPVARASEGLSQVPVGSTRDAHEPSAPMMSFGQAVAASVPESSPLPPSTQATAAASTLPAAAGEQVLQQLVSSIKMQWKDGIGEAKLHLRPEALGAVSVTLRVEAGAVTAVVRAESAQVQEWVVQHQQTLRQQMEAAGLRLDELVVSPDGQRQHAREESSPDPQQRRSRGHGRAAPREDEPRFELLA